MHRVRSVYENERCQANVLQVKIKIVACARALLQNRHKKFTAINRARMAFYRCAKSALKLKSGII